MDRPYNIYVLDSDNEREKHEAAAKQHKLSLLLIIFLILVAATMAFIRSSYFYLTDIAVEGIEVLGEEDVIQLSGIYIGTNIWKVDRDGAEDLLLQQPRIAAARVEMKLPDKILISIEEKSALGLIPYESNYIEVSGDGRLLGICGYVTEKPIITGLSSLNFTELTLEDGVERETVGKVLRAINNTGQELAKQVDFSQEEPIIFTPSGVVVMLGSSMELEKKLETLRSMLSYVENNFDCNEGYLDLVVPDHPTFKYFSGENIPEIIEQ